MPPVLPSNPFRFLQRQVHCHFPWTTFLHQPWYISVCGSGLKQYGPTRRQFWKSEVQNGSRKTKIKASIARAAFLLESSRGECIPLCFPVSSNCSYSSIFDPFLHFQNQQCFPFKPLSPPSFLTLASVLPSSQLLIQTLLLLSPRNLCDYSEPTWIIRDNLPTSVSLIDLHLQSTFFAL